MEVWATESKSYHSERYQFVTQILHRLSISPGTPGFYYMRDAVLFAYDLGSPVPAVSSLIYEEIVKRYGIERRKVERAMHFILEALAKSMSRKQALHIITGIDVDCVNKPFRNIEFISYLVEAMRLRDLSDLHS